MNINVSTIFILYFEQFAKVIAQGIPINPCPKIFQYRFNGSEWFGLVAVQNQVQQALQIRVTLSINGKPSTNFLGEIELLTRGQFVNNAPVFYQIHFPKLHYPPKLVLISVNNKVICFGSGDHSIFMTQIQLEHTRKLSFLSDKKSQILMHSTHIDSGLATDSEESPKFQKISSKALPHIHFKKKPFSVPNENCGRIFRSARFPTLQRNKHKMFESPNVKPKNIKIHDTIEAQEFVSLNKYYADSTNADLIYFSNDESDSANPFYFVNWQNLKTDSVLPSIRRGVWPWLAAIYVNNVTSLDFQCGGTLVSAQVVISSAHCFQSFNDRYTSNEVLVFLGRHNLKNWNEEGSLAASVNEIFVHSDFNKRLSNYDADIAIVLLKDQVRFNTFIQPVCLWSGSSKTEYIVGKEGIVIGWRLGKNGLEKLSNDSLTATASNNNKNVDGGKILPFMIKAPIVSNDVCFKANNQFSNLSSNRTFCAGVVVANISNKYDGFTNSRIYTGISGTGLVIFKNNLWMLRGTVSATLPSMIENTHCDNITFCSSNQYIIYSDVAKYSDWIMAFII